MSSPDLDNNTKTGLKKNQLTTLDADKAGGERLGAISDSGATADFLDEMDQVLRVADKKAQEVVAAAVEAPVAAIVESMVDTGSDSTSTTMKVGANIHQVAEHLTREAESRTNGDADASLVRGKVRELAALRATSAGSQVESSVKAKQEQKPDKDVDGLSAGNAVANANGVGVGVANGNSLAQRFGIQAAMDQGIAEGTATGTANGVANGIGQANGQATGSSLAQGALQGVGQPGAISSRADILMGNQTPEPGLSMPTERAISIDPAALDRFRNPSAYAPKPEGEVALAPPAEPSAISIEAGPDVAPGTGPNGPDADQDKPMYGAPAPENGLSLDTDPSTSPDQDPSVKAEIEAREERERLDREMRERAISNRSNIGLVSTASFIDEMSPFSEVMNEFQGPDKKVA